MSKMILRLPAILLLAAACQSPANAPRPYEAAQIRNAHPDGTLLRFRITQPGQGYVQNMRFENGTADQVDVVSWTDPGSGQQAQAPSTQQHTWIGLRDHATFDSASTIRQRARVTVPAGSFDCWQYTVTGMTPDSPDSQFYFADDMPGPPVLMVQQRGKQEILRMELLEHRPPT